MNKRDCQREGTLQLIYDTVNQLAEEKAYRKITVRDICERANISIGAFYHHFSSKQDLLFERYRVTSQFFESTCEEALLMPVEAGLKHLLFEAIAYLKSRVPEMQICYNEAFLRLASEWNAKYKNFTLSQGVERIIKHAIEQGEVSEYIPVSDLAAMFDIFFAGISLKQSASNCVYLQENQPELIFFRQVEACIQQYRK